MLKLKNALEKAFAIICPFLVIVTVVQISLIGKNLTFTTRFTPPSTQKQLKNQSYFTEVQVLILALSSMLLIIVPFLAYSIFLKSKRFFFPIWITFMVTNSILLLMNVYYMSGSQSYKSYLNEISKSISNTPRYCDLSICNKVTCVRIKSYKDSMNMTIAFSVIDLICSIYIVVSGFLINMKRRKTNQIQLIM